MGNFILALFVLYGLTPCLRAEVLRGTVRAQGRPVPGAQLESVTPGKTFTTTSGENGEWTLDLPAGQWPLKVTMFGFAPKELVAASSQPALTIDLELLPKPASRPTATSAPAAGFQNLAIAEIEGDDAPPPPPAPSDNAAESFLLSGSLSQALTQPTAAAQPMEEGPSAAMPSMAGAASSSGAPPGMDGSAGGKRGGIPGAGKASRKSGGRVPKRAAATGTRFGNKKKKNAANALRGSASWWLRDSTLDARPFSLTGQTVNKPDYSQNRFSVSLGGPLKIPHLLSGERTFIYGSYNTSHASNPFSAVATLPGALERTGDFSRSSSLIPVTIYDPSNNLPMPGNAIPSSRINPAARGLLDFIPLPNQPGTIQNYQFVTAVPQNNHAFSLRFNQALTTKDRLSLNAGLQTRSSRQTQIFGFLDESHGRGMNIDLGWSRTIHRRMVNSLRVSLNRNRSETLPFFAFQSNVAAELGIRGTSQDPVNYGPPNLNFTNFGGLTDASPLLRRDQTLALTEGLTYVRGKHNLSLGGDFRRIQHNNRTDQNARGTFTFSGLASSGLDAARNPLPGTGFDFADFLYGLPQSGSVRFGSSSNYFRGVSYSGYAQDDFRWKSNLSLNIGFRYEYASPFSEKRGQMANLDVAPGFRGVAVVTPELAGPYSGMYPTALVDPDRNNWMPRFGFAFKPKAMSHTTIRGGYGVYYNNSVYVSFASRLASQPPFARTSTVNTSAARPLTLQDGFTTLAPQTIRNTFAVDRGYRLGYAQSWNLSLQRELPRSFVLEATYLATKGTRLDIQRQPNRAAPGSPVDAEARRLIGNAVGFTFDSSEGNSIYHSGQARLTRRFRRGVSLNAIYTYAKSIDNVSTFGGGGAVVAQDDKDLSRERGLSTFDRRHNFNLTYVVTSPFSTNGMLPATGMTGVLLKDWTLNGSMLLQSGTPYTARVLGNRADTNGTGVIGNGRADASGLAIDAASAFFNPGAFGIPPVGRFGNAGRNTIPGPSMMSFNLSLGRSFRFSDRKRVELRMESQNITNHVNYTGLNAVVNSLNYGIATSAGPMRILSAQVRFRF